MASTLMSIKTVAANTTNKSETIKSLLIVFVFRNNVKEKAALTVVYSYANIL